MRTDLRSLTINELEDALKKLGEPAFRAKQIFSWVQREGVAGFYEMANIPKGLRLKLAEQFDIFTPKKLSLQSSKDGTKKFLWELSDGDRIESVLLDDEGRKTICISTQAGCKMNCAFCATARVKWKRNLSAGEIVSQVIDTEKECGDISNVVYMGMGEPLDNYDNVLKSIRMLHHPEGKNIGQRKITISTCGLPAEIKRFAGEGLQVRLALSLNATEDEQRNSLMPVNKKHPIKKAVEALKEYEKISGRRSTVEYLLIKGKNDSPEDAERLAGLLSGLKSNVNLITFNPFAGSGFFPSDPGTMNRFKSFLEASGFEVAQRYKRGADIDAACGQLTGRYEAKK